MTRAENTELREWLVRGIARHTGQDASDVNADRPFQESGLSSRGAVALAGELQEWLSRPLSATLLWEHPTINRLVAALSTTDGPTALVTTGDEPAEPVAVVGVGCRFPGGIRGPEALWTALRDGVDAVGEVPEGRWESFVDEAALSGVPRSGGFLDDISAFDAEYFEISPREAEHMDPQQRLLLEVACEALEHAGLPADRTRGSRTGVFVGVSSTEYGHLTTSDLDAIDVWTGTGAAASVVANRLSYFLDLRGPSSVVDTACSSSLVAVHQACTSLRSGESSLALAAGVNLLLSPAITVNFDRAGALAADGRCKAFDASADGITRGEGCGMVVLKRLADARRDGDRVLSVIRGSAVNSDGRSNGLMAPNPVAQSDLLRAAYGWSGVDPAGVDYVEAHGTGTLLGDPIEAQALAGVLSQDRSARQPLLLGSVKTNFGHLEAAAGIAGIIKVVLAMRHREIPPSLHFREPNPHIPFERDELEVVDQRRPWPEYSGHARAGVSGFGFGGTNAHVVLEAWPQRARRSRRARPSEPVQTLTLSGATPRRLRRRAADLAAWLDGAPDPAVDLADLGYTLARRRDHLRERAAVTGRARDELVAGLRAVAEDGEHPAVSRDTANAPGHGAVWVFSGYGSQWAGMGARLFADEPAFAAELERLDPLFQREAGFSVRELVADGRSPEGVRETQLALFGFQLALAALWRSHGLEPAGVLGHSLGEVTAAVVSGALDVATGLRVMRVRSTLLCEVDQAGAGAMAVVEASAEEVTRWAQPEVEVAVHFSPRRCTVAGPVRPVEQLVDYVDSLGRTAKKLGVSGAGHTAAVDGVLERLRQQLSDIEADEPSTAVYSTSAADPRDAANFGTEYWVRNLRQPVRFTEAVRAAAEDGHSTFVELSPHPVATLAVEETLASAGTSDPIVVFSSRRDTDDTVTFHTNLAKLHCAARIADLSGRYPQGRVVDSPLPAWQHRRYWHTRDSGATGASAAPGAPAGSAHQHPLLGGHVELPGGRRAWHGQLDADRLEPLVGRWPSGAVELGAAVPVELVVAAAAHTWNIPVGEVHVETLRLHEPLVLDGGTEVSTTSCRTGTASAEIEVHTRGAAGRWRCHATATALRSAREDPSGPRAAAVDGARITAESPVRRSLLNLAVLDRCLRQLAGDTSRVPELLEGLRVHADLPGDVRCWTGGERPRLVIDDPAGVALLEIDRAQLRPSTEPAAPLAGALWDVRWEDASPAEPTISRGSWLVVAEDVASETADQLAGELTAAGHRTLRLAAAEIAAPAALHAAGDSLAADPELPPRGVVLLTGGREGEEPGHVRDISVRLERLAEHCPGARLWWNTTIDPGFAGHALLRCLALAHPARRPSLVVGEPGARVLRDELLAAETEDEIAYRAGRRTVARVRHAEGRTARDEYLVRPDAYLVVGGERELAVAVWLAERGAGRIVFRAAGGEAEPDGAAPGFAEGIAELREGGVDLVVAEAGSDAARLRGLATGAGHALRGVVHAGAAETFAAGLRAATAGDALDWWLDLVPLDGLLGHPEHVRETVAHAAASDAARGQRDHPATVLTCPSDLDREELFAALAATLGSGSATSFARLDAERLRDSRPDLAGRPFVAHLFRAAGTPESDGGVDLAALRALPAEDATAAITARLVHQVAGILGASPSDIDPEAPLTLLGFDSLMATRARNAVERDFATALPGSLLMRGASLTDLAEHCAGEIGIAAVERDRASAQRSAPSVGPRDATERWLVGVWCAVLGRDSVSVKEDFFTAGGNALAAEEVAEQVGDRLGERWDTDRLFAEPTVERMAELVRESFEGVTGPVRVLRAEGDRTPLFVFHPAGGPTSVYEPLVRRLGAEQPCYGLERLGELDSVVDKAARYVEVMREIQPTGPYRLAGWSFGGCLAYEVARQLSAAGESIEVLALIDTVLPLPAQPGTGEAELLLGRFQRFLDHIERTYGHRPDLRLDELVEMDEQSQIERIMSALADADIGISDGALHHQYTSYVDSRVAERYDPQPYDGPVVLYRAREVEETTATLDPRYRRTDETLGWDSYVADLEVVRVSGNHLSMIDPPHVDVIAEHLGGVLEQLALRTAPA